MITPLRSNAVTLGYNYNDGDLLLEGAVPITDATGKISVPSVTYYRAFGFLGRSANVLAALPYGVGTFEGDVLGEPQSIYRSGLFDSAFRVSVNLAGGPAMSLAQMRQWQQKTLLGVTLKVIAPTGQYDPTKLREVREPPRRAAGAVAHCARRLLYYRLGRASPSSARSRSGASR